MQTSRIVNSIPILLTGLRAALAPVVVLLAIYDPSKPGFGVCLVTAFLSDVFDGIIARRLGVATPGLRRLDSIADSIFYVAATFAVWHLHAQAITDRVAPLLVLLMLEVVRYLFDLAKFRREASYHMWSSKLWGIALFGGFFSLLALGADNLWVSAMVYLGIVADIEGLAISVVLREWKTDVSTLWHALTMRGPVQPEAASIGAGGQDE